MVRVGDVAHPHPHIIDQHMNPGGREREERGKGGREEIEGRGAEREEIIMYG